MDEKNILRQLIRWLNGAESIQLKVIAKYPEREEYNKGALAAYRDVQDFIEFGFIQMREHDQKKN